MKALFAAIASLAVISASNAFAAPQLTVDQPIFNFGKIIQGKKVDHTFILHNSGDEPLQINAVKPACGCTAASVSSQSIGPGKKVELKTSFDSTNFSGMVKKAIAVETNDPRTPSFNLMLTGTISEEVEVSPRQVNFGRVQVGSPKTLQVTIGNRSGKTVKLTSLKASGPQASVTASKTVINNGETSTLSITVTPRESDRVISGYATVTTDHPTKGSITIPFYGSPSK